MVDAQLSRLSSVFDSCCLCSIVISWSKDSQCRNHGGKEDVVFVSESDPDVFYFWYGIFEVFEIL